MPADLRAVDVRQESAWADSEFIAIRTERPATAFKVPTELQGAKAR